ncbi:MAG: sulfotransferase, partial [Solirubrobacteraceae bacterium]
AANRCVERSSAILRPDLWPERRRLLPHYRRVAEELILAVADVAQAQYVVDSSHFPLRARELRDLPGIELYLIYLVRDPRDVVASNTRELSPHEVAEMRWRSLTMNAGLWLTQLLAIRTFLSHPADRRIFLRHEDFLDDPEDATRQILKMLGSRAELPDLQALTVGAPLFGNPLIRSDSVSVKRSRAHRPAHDPATSLAQAMWKPVLERLTPAVTRVQREGAR